jgi:hypothetical protein
MNMGLLLSVLMLSGCSTIATEPPADPSKYAEIDVKLTDGYPEVLIADVAVSTGFKSKYFGFRLDQEQEKPKRLFLSADTYEIQYDCYNTLSIGYVPTITITVESGKKYWLGCEHKAEHLLVYLEQQ